MLKKIPAGTDSISEECMCKNHDSAVKGKMILRPDNVAPIKWTDPGAATLYISGYARAFPKHGERGVLSRPARVLGIQ